MRKGIGGFKPLLAIYAGQNTYVFVDEYDEQSSILDHLLHRIDLKALDSFIISSMFHVVIVAVCGIDLAGSRLSEACGDYQAMPLVTCDCCCGDGGEGDA